MVEESKIEEVRRKIRDAIKTEKMFIKNEPDFSGHPNNTIAPEKSEAKEENEKRNPKQK